MTDPMHTFLPLFPLDLVVFPGESLKLHIFEPRYRQLIRECREDGITFGIPLYTEQRLAEYGTEMRLVEVLRDYPDGRMDVMTLGQRAFRLLRFIADVPDKPYSGGDVVYLANEEDPEPEAHAELWRLFRRLHELAGAKSQEGPEGPGSSFRIAPEAGLTPENKVRLLALEQESERQALLLDHLRRLVSAVEMAADTERKVKGNGHFKTTPKAAE